MKATYPAGRLFVLGCKVFAYALRLTLFRLLNRPLLFVFRRSRRFGGAARAIAFWLACQDPPDPFPDWLRL